MAMMQLSFIKDKMEALHKLVEEVGPKVKEGLKNVLQPNSSENSEDWQKMKRLM
jgi:hypothetical protein